MPHERTHETVVTAGTHGTGKANDKERLTPFPNHEKQKNN